MAGKNRSNQVSALISNWSQAEKALETSINSTGSAAKENAAYIDSIQGRIAQLKATFQDLSSDVISSELFKTLVVSLTNIINLIDKIVELTGPLAILLPSLLYIGDKKGLNLSSDVGQKIINSFKKIDLYIQKIRKNLKTPIKATVEVETKTNGNKISAPSKKTSAIIGSLTALAVALAVKAVIEAYEKEANKFVEIKNKLQDNIYNYENTNKEIDEINAQLEENNKKIKEINENNLTLIDNNELEKIKEANEELLQTKDILEKTNETQASLIQSQVRQLLNAKDYYITPEGIKSGIEGQDKIVEDVFKTTLGEPLYDVLKAIDFLGLITTGGRIATSLYGKKSGQESDYVTQANKLISEYHTLFARSNPYNTSLIYDDNGERIEQYVSDTERMQEIESSFAEMQSELSGYLQYLPEDSAEYETISGILDSIYNELHPFFVNQEKKNYTIELFEHYNEQYDNFTEGYKDYKKRLSEGESATEEDTQYIEFDKDLIAYNTLAKSGLLNGVSAQNYLQKEQDINTLRGSDDTKERALQILKDLFPEYQTAEGRFEQYYQESNNVILRSHIEDYANGLVSSIHLTSTEIESLIPVFESLGVNIDNVPFYIKKLANEAVKKQIDDLKIETENAKAEFVSNQTDFNDNFSNVKDTFSNAISSISSGSAISYEDMWTLINADSELATKFKKSANGYTIAIEDLTEAQEKYSKETKHTYLKAIEDAQKRIDKARADKDAAYKRLEKINPASDPQLYKEVRTQIDDYNETIETNTELIAKNQLMYEQACDSVSDYGQKLENVVSKLSTFKSLYASIANDMYKIGRIGAESMVELINAFPEDWHKLVTKSDNGYVLDDEAYTQTVIRKFGFSGADEKTIANDLKTNVEDKLKALADKYNLNYATGIPLDIQFGKIEDQAEEAGIDSGEFSSELNSLKDEFKDTNDIASIFADIIKTIIDSFKESKALTDFNNRVDKLQHKLNMGLITQTEYDDGFEAASTNFANAAKKEGLSGAETQEQIWSNEEAIHSAEQSRYQKKLDKKTQDLQDAYDQQLISAREYYDELAKLEDEYYGTETKKGLLDDPDGTNVENKNRQQLERRTTLVNDEIAQIKEDYSRGLITFEEFEQKLGESLDFWLGNIDELQETYKDLKRENISALYEAEVTLANNQLERGKMSNSQYAKEMLRIWEKYYKDKDGYRQEDLEAEQQAVEASRDAVQEQIDAFQHIIDKNEEDAEKQIDILEKQKEKIEDQYDKQIKELEEQKDLIEEAADAEDRKLKILEAEEALEKAKNQRTVATVNANGTINYQANPEDVKKAEEDLKEAKKEEETAKLQERIDALEKEKETKTNTIDEEIKKIEEKRDKTNGYLQAVVDMLATLISETYEIDPELIKRLLNSKDAKAELEKINEEREAAGEEAITWADVGSAITSVEELIDSESTQEEKDDAIVDAIESTSTELKPIYKKQLGPDNTDKDTDKNTDKDTNQDTTNNANTNTNNEIANKDNKTDDKTENSEKNDNTTTENTNTLGTELNPMYVKLFNTPIPVTITDNVIESVSGEKAIYQTIDNQTNNNNNNFTFSGDIYINNPVTNSYDLAEDIVKNLPNAVAKQIHKKNQ